MSDTLTRSHIKDCLSAILVATLLSAVLVLLFAIITKFFPAGDNVISIINLAIKAVSVFIGVFTRLKNNGKGLIKGALTGIIFSIISLAILILLGGEFNWSSFSVELGVCLAVGVLSGILASGRSR